MTILTVLFSITLSLLFAAAFGAGSDKNGKTSGTQPNIHDPGEQVGDWRTALQYLVDGNLRYVANRTMARETNARDRDVLKNGQKPFAVVVTCADSRVAPEIYFDQKLGDIFVLRNAGNIADATVLGSIEYAVEHLRAPLIVVVGHSKCGAVSGAYNGGEFPGNLQTILDTIRRSIRNSASLEDAIYDHMTGVVKRIEENDIVEETGAKVIGAIYDIETGKVTFTV